MNNIITNYTLDNNVLIIQTESKKLKIEAATDSCIHIIYTGRDEFSTKKSYMVLDKDFTSTLCKVDENDKKLIFSTRNIKLEIDKSTLSFTWRDKNNKLLVKEPKKGGKYLIDIEVKKPVYDSNTEVKSKTTVDGNHAVVEPIGYDFDRMAYSTKLELAFSEDEAIYGLGQHENGIFNYRGKQQYIYQQNMNIACPFFVSTNGYGFLMDSYSLGEFCDNENGSYYWAEIEDEMDFYFMYGPSFDEIIAQYRNLTGKATMFPLWAYGFVQSKERYHTQDEVVDIVKKYRELEVPLDCIVQDWMYWKEGYWSEKSFDETRYPDPQKFYDDIHNENAKLMISIWPNMRGNGPNQEELSQAGYMFKNKSSYNPFIKGARDMYWKQCEEGLFNYGLDAWWCDCSEPFEKDWYGETKRPPYVHMMEQTSEFKKYMDGEYINSYTLLHAQAMYEGQRAVSDKRMVNLTRSHFPGQQRYGTITWSGDTAATWDVYRKQIAEGLNFCASGAPKWTLDIGGFFVNNKNLWFWKTDYTKGMEDKGFCELYTRWYQYGAFLPMFRSHGTDISREIWNFGKKGEMFYDSIELFTHLRYRFLPYIYTMAGMVTHKDYTMLRALAFDFADDKNVYDIADQFMFGTSIMVCPVTTPMYYEANSIKLTDIPKGRIVYLPAGCNWYDFWTGELYSGGNRIFVKAPIDKIPLFIKAGSIIPMGPFAQYAEEKLEAPWELRVYPGANGRFEIYEDKGDSYDYENSEYSWLPISWDDKASRLTLGDREGDFPELINNRQFNVVKVGLNKGVGINVSKDIDKVIDYTGEEVTISL
jgi:alpha-D-xyloside xylohydrolase